MTLLRPILLAEDSPNDAELFVTALREADVLNEIIVAQDGEQALDCLHRRGTHAGRTGPDFAVVFLDLKMPRLDGYEVLNRIRSDPRLAPQPVVVLTSSREESDLHRIYRLGINAYVVKPVEFGEFLRVIGRLGVFWALHNELPSTPEKTDA